MGQRSGKEQKPRSVIRNNQKDTECIVVKTSESTSHVTLLDYFRCTQVRCLGSLGGMLEGFSQGNAFFERDAKERILRLVFKGFRWKLSRLVNERALTILSKLGISVLIQRAPTHTI